MDRPQIRQLGAIPNLFSCLRILLVPEFLWLYVGGERPAALAVLVLSGVSDFLDGRAARRLGLVTPLGKILDPVADKLTQFAVISCLATEYNPVIFLLCILFAKEASAAVCGAALLASGGGSFSSLWYGKLSTGALYVFSGILLLWRVGRGALLWLTVAASCVVLAAFVLYTFEFVRKITGAYRDG
ncbi:MAG TPA: CDP-alcohol phosphatidyltransferase family protein [Clostridiales bacterium]|jgi:cardiolipin synthase|nr:CDP-alcohol phosphatidyltransferase family protein [Clostridiales bacterium]